MSAFEIEARDGRYSIRFDEATDIVGLTMAPSELEPALAHGQWLVLVFAVWSTPDRAAIEDLVASCADAGPGWRIGVRPFDAHDELQSWCPEASERHGSPLWLVLKGGRLVAERVGVLGSGELGPWLSSLS